MSSSSSLSSFDYLLLESSKSNDLEKIKESLNLGANINAKDTFGNTALSISIKNSNKDAIILLCNQGADPNIIIYDYGTSLIYSSLYGIDKSIVDILIETKKIKFEFKSHEFSFKGNIEELKKISNSIPNVDSFGNNELHYASSNGNLNIIIWLIEQQKGFSINDKNNEDETILLLSALNGHLSIVKWLFEKGSALKEKITIVKQHYYLQQEMDIYQ